MKKSRQIQEILKRKNPQGFLDRLAIWRGIENGGIQSIFHVSNLSGDIWTVVTSANRECRKKNGFYSGNYTADDISTEYMNRMMWDAESG